MARGFRCRENITVKKHLFFWELGLICLFGPLGASLPAALCLYLYLAGIQLTLASETNNDKWSPGAVPTFSDPCNHPARFLSYSSKMEPKQQRVSLEMRLSSHESITRVAFTCTHSWPLAQCEEALGHGYMDGRFVVLTHRPIKVRRSWFHARWCDYSSLVLTCGLDSRKSLSQLWDLQDKTESCKEDQYSLLGLQWPSMNAFIV